MITHNSTGGVVSAAVRLAFADITETNIPINQVFVSNFEKVRRFMFTSILRNILIAKIIIAPTPHDNIKTANYYSFSLADRLK